MAEWGKEPKSKLGGKGTNSLLPQMVWARKPAMKLKREQWRTSFGGNCHCGSPGRIHRSRLGGGYTNGKEASNTGVHLSTKAPQCRVENQHPPQVDLIADQGQPLAWLLTVGK